MNTNEYQRAYYHSKIKTNPIKYAKHLDACRWTRRKRKYGISKDEYDQLLAAQEGRCYICKAYEENLRVDHDHATQKVRGLLCPMCNSGLGSFRDDPIRLRAAADYLEQSKD